MVGIVGYGVNRSQHTVTTLGTVRKYRYADFMYYVSAIGEMKHRNRSQISSTLFPVRWSMHRSITLRRTFTSLRELPPILKLTSNVVS